MKITLTNLISEEIAPDPLDGKSYPVGSGVSVYLKLEQQEKAEEVVLSQLPASYASNLSILWGGYRIELEGVEEMEVRMRIVGN